MINVCKEINCPYFRAETNGFGCQLYASALHCHLIHPGHGIHKDGFESTTEYCVYAEKHPIEELKAENENYLSHYERYLRDSELIKSGRELDYPNRLID